MEAEKIGGKGIWAGERGYGRGKNLLLLLPNWSYFYNEEEEIIMEERDEMGIGGKKQDGGAGEPSLPFLLRK